MIASDDRARSVRLRVRWDDCDRYGHLNNAAYLAVAREAHDGFAMPGERLVEFEISYRMPVEVGATVEVIAAADPQGAPPGAGFDFLVGGRPAAAARAVWSDGDAGPCPGLEPPARDAGGQWFSHEEAVRTYHLGPDGLLRPQVVLQWFEHAVFRAASVAGWWLRRMDDAGFVSLVVGHDLRLGPGASEGERLGVFSRLVDVRRVSGTWLHELRRPDGAVLARDYARGAFLDRSGRIRPAPEGLIDDLLLGERPPADEGAD